MNTIKIDVTLATLVAQIEELKKENEKLNQDNKALRQKMYENEAAKDEETRWQ